MNSDGFLDVVTGNEMNLNKLYLGNGDGTFAVGIDIGSGNDITYSVAMGDVNGDGLLDIVAGNATQPNMLYLNEGRA